MVEKLEIGQYYKIFLADRFSKYGPMTVQVNAISTKKSLHLYGDFNIRGEFFADEGINTYLTLVNDSTVIYVCNVVKSYKPVKIDAGRNIFIPATIIDMKLCHKFIITTDITVRFDGINRMFDSPSERMDFLTEATKVLPDLVKNSDFFLNDDIRPEFSEETSLLSEEIIRTREREKEKAIDERRKRQIAHENIGLEYEIELKKMHDKIKFENRMSSKLKGMTFDDFVVYSELYDKFIDRFKTGDTNNTLKSLNLLLAICGKLPPIEFKNDWKYTINEYLKKLKDLE